MKRTLNNKENNTYSENRGASRRPSGNDRQEGRPGAGMLVLKSLLLLAAMALLALVVVKRAGVEKESGSSPAEFSAPITVEAEPVEEVPVFPVVIVSEAMPSNESTFMSEGGTFSDWVELYNSGDEEAKLSDYTLESGGTAIAIDGVLAPGEYKLVSCPGLLKAKGGKLTVKDPSGEKCDVLEYAECEKDVSVARVDGIVEYTDFPTPGYENTDAGYETFQASKTVGELSINEVMVYNDSLLRTEDYQFYDWVELKNVSSEPIRLSEYYLSDSNSDRLAFQLPDTELQPGAFYIIYCVGDTTIAAKSQNYAPFGLDADRDELYLSTSDGTLSDCVTLRRIPIGGSYGHMPGQSGFFYFSNPTPTYENANGLRSVTNKPVSLGQDGVFTDSGPVTVELSGKGDIYYTTGGAVPTESSTKYTGPFQVSSTTVIRAVCIEPGKITGTPLTLSYIFCEGHSLPVVSLVAPRDDWEMVYYSPAKDFERAGAVEYFGEDGSFSIDCGFKLHGETSRSAEKKSLKLQFKSRYEGKLVYDIFGNGVTEFSSILLRAAREDTYSSQMRDALMHRLAIAAFPELPSQDYKYAVLYVNGQYWGLYNLREAHSVNHYAKHYGYTASTVEMYREDINVCPELSEIYKYMLRNPVSTDENYNYVENLLNIDSVIGWSIIQAYSGNIDCYPNNVRMYYSPEDGKVRYALLDLDLGMFGKDAFSIAFDNQYRYTDLARGLTNSKLYRTELLEQLSAALLGPLSNESVIAAIDEMQAQMDPEVYADRAHWGGTYVHWQQMIDELRAWVSADGGRAKVLANSIRSYFGLSEAEYNQYFGNVK